MGRKSNKGQAKERKEKKQKWQEESAKVVASQTKVDAANALEDPLAQLAAFKKYDRNGLSVAISCETSKNLDEETMEWGFQLTKSNMQKLYEDSEWGWNDKQKKDEMLEEEARYLIVRDQENKPVGVVHFRFDLDEDEEVLYCYEVQLEKSVRRKGLGKFLMQILELMAHKTQMKKVMLTAFKHNPDAQEFFKNKLKFVVDETSPEDTVAEAMFDEEMYTYEILSKPITPRQPVKKAPAQNGTAQTKIAT